MKKRVAVIAMLGVVVVSGAALRGCWDPTKPIASVSDVSASVLGSVDRGGIVVHAQRIHRIA
jgi:hypothetical protein